MAEAIWTLCMAILFILLVALVVRHRRVILVWLSGSQKPKPKEDDLEDYAVLKKYGIENAIELIKKRQEEDKGVIEALRPSTDEDDSKPEE